LRKTERNLWLNKKKVNNFTKYQAQNSPHPLGMEVSYAGSYIYDSNNKKYFGFVAGFPLVHLVTSQQG
jgi:hypothetical protein